MAIRFCIFDVGRVCYPYSFDSLNNFLWNKTIRKEDVDTKGGAKSFNYSPFMKGEIDFSLLKRAYKTFVFFIFLIFDSYFVCKIKKFF